MGGTTTSHWWPIFQQFHFDDTTKSATRKINKSVGGEGKKQGGACGYRHTHLNIYEAMHMKIRYMFQNIKTVFTLETLPFFTLSAIVWYLSTVTLPPLGCSSSSHSSPFPPILSWDKRAPAELSSKRNQAGRCCSGTNDL